jgi:hypothetical protein
VQLGRRTTIGNSGLHQKRQELSTSGGAPAKSDDRASDGYSRRTVAAALVVGLLIGAGTTYALAGPLLSRTTTTTTTALPAVTSTSTTTVTNSQTSQAVATVASSGLRLSTFVNATDIIVGQRLNISVSVFNTLPTANAFFPQRSFEYSDPGEVGNWTFYGIPVATWPECSNRFPFSWPMPIDVVVLNGNYTAQELPAMPNTTSAYTCGITSPAIPSYTFEPNSDIINMTVLFDGGAGNRPMGLFQLSSNFTIGGYWDLASASENNPSICEPAVLNLCAPPPSTPFAPGVYTIGVSDEWGQYDVLHFQVSGSG